MQHLRVLRASLVLALGLVAGCSGNRPPADGSGGPAPSAAVERFLHLAAEERYVDMGWVFGTERGPVIQQWPRPEVEQRMYAIGRVLTHDSFIVGPSSPVPGRIGRAERFTVTLQRGARNYTVPFVVVSSGGRWFVERVDLEAVTTKP